MIGQQVYELLNLVWQNTCPLCQRSTPQTVCPDCQRQLQGCQLPQQEQMQAGQPALFAWGNYGGTLKRTIATLKYQNHPELARPLAQWLAQSWLDSACDRAQRFTVVPIPMHKDKQQQRGFNQAELLAERFCQVTQLPLAHQGLMRCRTTEAQFSLSATDREHNLAHAFVLGAAFSKKLPTQPVLLLDDIYTTGATVRAATQTLRRHGIRVSGVIVVARAKKVLPDR